MTLFSFKRNMRSRVVRYRSLIYIRARDSSKIKYDRYDARAVDARDSSKIKYDRYEVHDVDARDSSKVKYDRYD